MGSVVMTKISTVCFTGNRLARLGGYEPNNPVATWVRERLMEAADYLWGIACRHL
jgi:hypothetical protein